MLTSFQTSTTASITASTAFSSSKADIKISTREQEVLNLIAYEHTAKEIANKLYISYETVNSHRKNIMSKLGVKNTAGMVRVAFELRLIHQQ